MEISLEKEFQFTKAFRVFRKVCEKLSNYENDSPEIDIPEFCKMSEDKIEARADRYVTRIINEGKLDEVYNKIIG